jgi:membrane-bound lytic murein transglycosylase D
MNTRTVGISGFVVLFIALFLLPNAIQAELEKPGSEAALSENEMRWRIDNLLGPFDYRYTSKVKSEVESYVLDYRKGAEELLGRVTIYFPIFEQKIVEKNLPREIKYLSLIESGLKVNAYSSVGAAGLWQFMRGTAKEYGLTVNRSIDQRYAVEESTEAALNYLSSLYDQFGDWTLALAAYNCGPGNVRKAMRRSGKADYWSIRNYLPRETRNYIPKFVAATYLMQYYYEHDLMPVRPDDYYFQTLESKVFQHISFAQIASLTDTPIEVIRNLNPSYRKYYIPANTTGLKLILPSQTMYSLLESNVNQSIQLVDHQRVDFNGYIRTNFKPEIARYLLVEHPETIEMNAIPSKDIAYYFASSRQNNNLAINDKLVSLIRVRRNDKQEDNDYVIYRLRSGETLMEVARKFNGVDVAMIIRNNNLKMNQSPPPGTLLRIKKI